jgi:hypothetical protein
MEMLTKLEFEIIATFGLIATCVGLLIFMFQ